MTAVAILAASVLGFLCGLVGFLFFDQTLLAAFAVYLGISFALSVVAIAVQLILGKKEGDEEALET